jgi:hypothetical protein
MPNSDVFSLVQQFDKMRQGLGTGGGGIGRPQENPKVVAAQNAWNQRQQGGDPAPAPAVAPSFGGKANLVEWGGHRFDKSVVPHLEEMSSRFPGLRLSSGYRDPQHNARVNGVKNSYHLTGRAADFSGSAKDMQEGAAWAKANGGRVLIHNAGSGQHLHVSWG